ncbi:hypothetical protein Pmani_026664 [Petrolisthes manimaculis]|uniref:Secreted protein n=1 Tax=Petrolisthes manimaculis TaxID=1843537 RepID=A0AAE1P485_9EUCA|nr:hypothetical protein Pmani_026664 [Petrolisthes manimaculis]
MSVGHISGLCVLVSIHLIHTSPFSTLPVSLSDEGGMEVCLTPASLTCLTPTTIKRLIHSGLQFTDSI